MRDIQVISRLVEHYASHTALVNALNITLQMLSNWKHNGIPATWRPTIWALLEQRCPEVAAELDRDEFLGVRLPQTEDAA